MAAAAQAEDERAMLGKLWRQRVERARYAADRARRQYQLAEPENRLVTRQLESDWEAALAETARLEADYQRFAEEQPATLTAAERAAIQALAGDLPRVWSAPSTTQADRKELLRILIEDITVNVAGDSEIVDVTITWAGGHQTAGQAVRPVGRLDQLSYFPALLARVSELAEAGRNSRQIADALNAEGFRPPKRTSRFTGGQVRAMITQRGIRGQPKGRPAALAGLPPGQWSVPGLAAELSMPVPTVYTWIYRGWITARRAPGTRSWIITADDQQMRELRERRARPPGYYVRRRWDPPNRNPTPARSAIMKKQRLTGISGGPSRCPAGSSDADEVLIGRSRGGAAQVIGEFELAPGVAGERAADQQVPGPPGRCGAVVIGHGGGRPVIQAGAFGAVAAAAALPGLRRGVRGQDIGAGGAGAAGDGLVAGDGDDVADPAGLQPGPELMILAVGLIGGHPRSGNAGVQRPAQHRPGELGLGSELDVRRDARLTAAVPVRDPRFRQIQLAVDQRPALAAGIRAEHAQLAVLHPAGRTGVLPLHPGGLDPLLEEPGLINHQHPAGRAQVPDDIGTHVVTDPVVVPGGPVEQPLHPVRRRIPGCLGQRPAVLGRQRRQQAPHIRAGPQPRLDPEEPAGH